MCDYEKSAKGAGERDKRRDRGRVARRKELEGETCNVAILVYV